MPRLIRLYVDGWDDATIIDLFGMRFHFEFYWRRFARLYWWWYDLRHRHDAEDGEQAGGFIDNEPYEDDDAGHSPVHYEA